MPDLKIQHVHHVDLLIPKIWEIGKGMHAEILSPWEMLLNLSIVPYFLVLSQQHGN